MRLCFITPVINAWIIPELMGPHGKTWFSWPASCNLKNSTGAALSDLPLERNPVQIAKQGLFQLSGWFMPYVRHKFKIQGLVYMIHNSWKCFANETTEVFYSLLLYRRTLQFSSSFTLLLNSFSTIGAIVWFEKIMRWSKQIKSDLGFCNKVRA